ncbi:MAG: serine protease [bacterium]
MHLDQKVFSVAAFLVLMSCTQQSREMFVPEEFKDHDVNEALVKGKSLKQARLDIQNARLECSAGKCSQGVALLAAVGQSTSQQADKKYFVKESCTASFVKLKNASGVEETFALTAGHCIPKRLKVGSSCSSDIQLVLGNGRKVPCETVAFVAEPADEQIKEVFYDLALLKISDSSGVAFYEFNQKGLKAPGDLHSVKMIAMDPDPNWEKTLKATLRETDCWYLQNSYVLPNSRDSRSPLFMNQDCRLIGGNSGAPILDGGTIVGVQSNWIQFDPPVFPNGSIGVASNVSCFDEVHKKLRCEARTERFFMDEHGNLFHKKYMELVHSLFLENKIHLFNKKTQRFMQSLWEQNNKYKESQWAFIDIQNDNSQAFRIPFMRCVPPSIEAGSKVKEKLKAVVYGVEMPSLKLSLVGRVMTVVFERVYLGNGTFRLNTFLSPDGYWEVKRPLCNSL